MRVLILALMMFAVACGRDVSKKFPDQPSDNNGTNNANNAANNTNTGTIVGSNNGTTTTNNNNTVVPINNTIGPINNTTGPNNTTNNANNSTNNNTTPPDDPPFAYISGQADELDAELVLAGFAFAHVGGDEGVLLEGMRDFWLLGEADDYDVVVVEWGFHSTNLGDTFPQDHAAVMAAVSDWVENGGLLLDLSGGFAYNAFPGFYEIVFALVQPGTYRAFARDPSMPFMEFAWAKANDDRNMAGVSLDSINPAEGETLLVDGTATMCELTDFNCLEPTFDRPTALFVSKDVGQGTVYNGGWVPPLDDDVVTTVFSVLPE